MKKIVFAALILAVSIVSCRKKELRDVTTADTLGPAHCMDGYQGGDELGVDCGGADCDPCSQTTLPCTLDSNEIYYLESSVFVTDQFINQTYSVSTGGAYTFRAYTADGDSMHLIFSGKPDVEQVYGGTAYSSGIDNDEVFIEYFQPFPLDDYIGSGSVYVNHANGAYTISSCDYKFQTWGQPTPTWTQYFSVTF